MFIWEGDVEAAWFGGRAVIRCNEVWELWWRSEADLHTPESKLQSFDNVKMPEGKWRTLLVLYRAGLDKMHKAIPANYFRCCKCESMRRYCTIGWACGNSPSFCPNLGEVNVLVLTQPRRKTLSLSHTQSISHSFQTQSHSLPVSSTNRSNKSRML
jgi:hypothetical protein